MQLFVALVDQSTHKSGQQKDETDDGRGFSESALGEAGDPGRGMGLLGMRERADMLVGRSTCRSPGIITA